METNDNIKYAITDMTVNDIAKWCEDNGFTGGKSSDGVCKIVKGKDGKTITNHYDRWHYERVKHEAGIDIFEYVDMQEIMSYCYMAMADVHAVIDRVIKEDGSVFDLGSTIASAKHWESRKEDVERIISLRPQVIAMAKQVLGME